MSRRPQRRKHVPQRMCVACRTARPKRELVRIVRLSSPGEEGAVEVDETGKRKGRGAYLCRQQACWEMALARGQLEQALKVTVTAEIAARLREYAARLPQLPTIESGERESNREGR
jgi:predicted RNA-binding protein YlxR (DUF448 family)